jgi:hypothetical protein
LPIAQEHNFVQVSFVRDSTPFGDADMKHLLPLAEQITWLDLRNTEIKDFSALAQLKNLSRVHLELSAIQDADLVHLSQLEQLEYLNLYGTEISNEGLSHLEALPNLKTLYLWQSQVDEAAARELVEKMPQLEINMGWETTIRKGDEAAPPEPETLEQAG